MSMPRYFLFAYPRFYPAGGFHDLVFTSDSIQECKDLFESEMLDDTRSLTDGHGDKIYGDWYQGHIVDSELNMTPVLFVEVEYEKKMDAKPIKVTWSETYKAD